MLTILIGMIGASYTLSEDRNSFILMGEFGATYEKEIL
jgi:hypothetical protein